MNRYLRYFILPALFLLLSSFMFSVQEVVNALKAGDASLMSRYFDARVEITLHDKTQSYSKSQAQQVLDDFFDQYGVKKFEVLHQGNNAGSEFCIGTLTTKSNSEQFRVTIFMQARGTQQFLQEIRLEAR
jgi:Domain of unknown function (DUF4783)